MVGAGKRRFKLSLGRGVSVGIAAGLLLLLGFTAYTLRLAENAVEKEARGRVRSTTELSARVVGEQQERFKDAVSGTARRLSAIHSPVRAVLAPDDRARAQAALNALVDDVAGLESAILTDRLGRAVATAPEGSLRAGRDLSGRDWYRGVTATNHAYVSRAYTSAASGHPRVTTVAAAVRDADGQTVAIVVASELHRTQMLVDDLGRQLGVTITVTDQAGVIVARTADRSPQLRSRAPDPLVAAALRGRSGVRSRDVDGTRSVSGYAPVSAIGWTVTADVSEDDAFSDIPQLRLSLLLGAAVVAFLLFWTVPLLVRRLGSATQALDVSDAFQSDLLPDMLPRGVHAHYVASERRMKLGGDFLDAVRLADGSLAVCVGDVCGHGPRAAALSATLRAGWRTLATAGSPVERLDLLDRLVESSRRDDDLFATVACAVIAPDATRVQIALAGHPPPVIVLDDGTLLTVDEGRGPALGIGAGPDATWPASEFALSGRWSLALYTDGLIEAFAPDGRQRVGVEGFCAMLTAARRDGTVHPGALLGAVNALGGAAGLDDDVALVLVDGMAVSSPEGY